MREEVERVNQNSEQAVAAVKDRVEHEKRAETEKMGVENGELV